ncbi:hypothetical protein [Parasedimentitalea marina]|nr:hypothetical protein [Parasedimentitalea marina]
MSPRSSCFAPRDAAPVRVWAQRSAGDFEITRITPELRGAIDAGVSETALKELALAPEETLTGQGLAAVAAGTVSLEEVLRVAGDMA